MADYKLYLGELLVGRAKEQVEPVITNYVKISNVDSSGTILELGSGYDTSNYSSDPPIIYGPDGSEVDVYYWDSSVIAYITSTTYYKFNSSTNPTSYQRIHDVG